MPYIYISQVPLSEIQFHMMDQNAMCIRTQMKLFPPRIPFYVRCDGASQELEFKITIDGAKAIGTDKEVFFITRVKPPVPTHGSKRSFKVSNSYVLYDQYTVYYMFIDIQHQSAMDMGLSYGHKTQIFTLSVLEISQLQTSQPQASQQARDPLSLVVHSDTQHPKVSITNISQSSSEQDSPSLHFYFSFPSSSDDAYVNTTPIPVDHCEDCKLSQEEKELPVKEKNILKICYELKSWKKTARDGFGLTEAQVRQLENDYKPLGDNEYAFQSYLKWKMQNGYTDTYTITLCEMVEILRKSQEHEAIKKLKRYVLEAEDTNLSVVES